METHPDGRIDWDNGVVYGVGRGYLHQNKGSRQTAMRAAQTIALQSILKIAGGIRLDDRDTLQSLGKGRFVLQLQGLVRFEEHESRFVEGPEPYLEVTRKADLKGVEGLAVRLLDRFKSAPDLWRDFPGPAGDPEPEDAPETWLVLDARKSFRAGRMAPALFPRIVDRLGNPVYSLNTADEGAFRERGMARYVLSDLSRTRKSSDAGTGSADLVAAVSRLLSIRDARAEEAAGSPKKREKRREFIVKDADQAQGMGHTNLVISETDAEELKTADASSQVLKKCRVIIVADSPLGGVEGALNHWIAAESR